MKHKKGLEIKGVSHEGKRKGRKGHGKKRGGKKGRK